MRSALPVGCSSNLVLSVRHNARPWPAANTQHPRAHLVAVLPGDAAIQPQRSGAGWRHLLHRGCCPPDVRLCPLTVSSRQRAAGRVSPPAAALWEEQAVGRLAGAPSAKRQCHKVRVRNQHHRCCIEHAPAPCVLCAGSELFQARACCAQCSPCDGMLPARVYRIALSANLVQGEPHKLCCLVSTPSCGDSSVLP